MSALNLQIVLSVVLGCVLLWLALQAVSWLIDLAAWALSLPLEEAVRLLTIL